MERPDRTLRNEDPFKAASLFLYPLCCSRRFVAMEFAYTRFTRDGAKGEKRKKEREGIKENDLEICLADCYNEKKN